MRLPDDSNYSWYIATEKHYWGIGKDIQQAASRAMVYYEPVECLICRFPNSLIEEIEPNEIDGTPSFTWRDVDSISERRPVIKEMFIYFKGKIKMTKGRKITLILEDKKDDDQQN